MEISQRECDPLFRSMSREFTHPEDVIQRSRPKSNSKSQLEPSIESQPTNCGVESAIPPPHPRYQTHALSFKSPSNLHISELLSILRQFFIQYPADFSFHNWIWRISIYHQNKLTTFAVHMYTDIPHGNSYILEGNYLQGDYLLFQKAFSELQSSFQPSSSMTDVWDDSLPSLDGFLFDDQLNKETPSEFDNNLQAISSMLNSPYLDMKYEALSILLPLMSEPSFLLSLSQLTSKIETYSNYFAVVNTLVNLTLLPTNIQPGAHQDINCISLALGCLAHLSQHVPTSLYLSNQREFLCCLATLSAHPLCILQCNLLQKHLKFH